MNTSIWMNTLVLCLLYLCHGSLAEIQRNQSYTSENAQAILKKLLNGYDTRLRPNITGEPATVKVDFSILSFGHIEEVNMVFPVDMFFRQRWYDPRLKHCLDGPLVLMMGKQHPADTIWVPDTVFINSIKSRRHHVTVNNDKLDIYPDGKVFWGTRVTSIGSCRLDLRSYPMDTQTCSIGVESYAYPVDHMIYKWDSRPGIKIIDQEMSQYELIGYKTGESFVDYVAGNYSILNADFTFKRRVGHSILQIYIPTIAIVCVSWISLWIDKESTAARVSLCITTLLTLSTIWGAVNSTLPRVSYIKAVDVFFMVSFFFVFYTLVQYTLVINLSSKSQYHNDDDEDEDRPLNPRDQKEHPLIAESYTTEEEQQKRDAEKQLLHCPGSKSYQNMQLRLQANANTNREESKKIFLKCNKKAKTSRMDLVARVALPAGYLMFNIYYWTKYMGSRS